MKYLVVGAKGQLGREVVRFLKENDFDFVQYGSEELDITNRDEVFDKLRKNLPDVVIDAAAYTKVDAAEAEGKDMNWLVNAEGTKNLADAAAEIKAKMVYFSTDYVFDGTGDEPYSETATVNPQNEYGRAKLEGEKNVVKSGVGYYIIRTSWVFGEFGHNFVYTMRKLGANSKQIKVVNDQIGRPTWTKTLAEFVFYLLHNDVEYGVYNLSNDESATWYEFASEILRNFAVNVEPVSSDAFPTKASRPKYSVLDLNKTKGTGFVIPKWTDALYEFESEINHTI